MGSTSPVKDHTPLHLFSVCGLVDTERQGCSDWLGYDFLTLESGYGASVFGGYLLRVVEVCWNGDHAIDDTNS